jgi:YVTN family beta-propeller protein
MTRCFFAALVGAISMVLGGTPSSAQNAEAPNTVSVIDTASNAAVGTIPAGPFPFGFPIGVAVSPDGTKVYVTNELANTVSVIDSASWQPALQSE